jgi:hypothetical protein
VPAIEAIVVVPRAEQIYPYRRILFIRKCTKTMGMEMRVCYRWELVIPVSSAPPSATLEPLRSSLRERVFLESP